MSVEKKILVKCIEKYYKTLEEYTTQDAFNESTVENAFKQLLNDIGSTLKLTLVKESMRTKSGKNITPDGIVRDEFKLTRGIWEAKDSKDNLDVEISKKIGNEYPLKNIIFE